MHIIYAMMELVYCTVLRVLLLFYGAYCTVLYCTIENSKLWTLRFGDSCSIAPEPKKGRFLEKPELSRGLENNNEVSHTHTSSKGRFSTERDHYYRGGYRSRLYCLRTFSTLTVTPSDC